MSFPLSLFISLRFGRGSQRNNGILSLVSIISTISIMLGVIVLITGLSAMNGFERELNNRILAVMPHGEIEPINQPWVDWKDILLKIKEVPGVMAAAPYINFTGLIETRANLRAIQVKGIDPYQEASLSTLPSFVQKNAWSNFRAGEKQIIIGKGITDALKIKHGDWVSLMLPSIRNNYRLQQPKHILLHVIGIFQLNGQIDHNLAIIPLNDAKQYLNVDNSVTGIAIKVSNLFNVNKPLRKIGQIINRGVYIKSWINTYHYMYHDIQVIRAIIYLAMLLTISIACFNIIASLMMTVKNKNSDIAILRTLGAKSSLIHAIFIWWGFSLGGLGGLCGVIIGIVISLNLTTIIHQIEKTFGYQFLSGDIYFIDFLPSEIHCFDVICVLVATFLLSILASWYPAHRASCIDPVRVFSSK